MIPTLKELAKRIEALEEERESRLDNLLVYWPSGKFTSLVGNHEVDINDYDSEKVILLPVRYQEEEIIKNPAALERNNKSIEKEQNEVTYHEAVEETPDHKRSEADKPKRKGKPFRQLVIIDKKSGDEIERKEF